MTSNNRDVCNLIKDTISFMKDERYFEARQSLDAVRSELQDDQGLIEHMLVHLEQAETAKSKRAKEVEEKERAFAFHEMQAVINMGNCNRELHDFLRSVGG
jgi:hypothetical protein